MFPEILIQLNTILLQIQMTLPHLNLSQNVTTKYTNSSYIEQKHLPSIIFQSHKIPLFSRITFIVHYITSLLLVPFVTETLLYNIISSLHTMIHLVL